MKAVLRLKLLLFYYIATQFVGMKRSVLILILAILSAVSGYLLSRASLVGRVGINLFYKEYKFLKIWWQGALVVFIVLLVLLFLQGLVQKKLIFEKAKQLHIIAIVAALVGLYFTYNDFRHTTSHRLLGERFHLGGYLFWIGWILISIYYLAKKTQPTKNILTDYKSENDNLPDSLV